MTQDIFADEWRDCLRAHYMHVIRTRDRVTEPSLTVVMHQADFDDSELAELRVRATMHMDDVGEDFVPDLEVLNLIEAVDETSHLVAVPEMPSEVLEELQIETELPEAVLEDESMPQDTDMSDEPDEDEPEDDPDAPQQLSLF